MSCDVHRKVIFFLSVVTRAGTKYCFVVILQYQVSILDQSIYTFNTFKKGCNNSSIDISTSLPSDLLHPLLLCWSSSIQATRQSHMILNDQRYPYIGQNTLNTQIFIFILIFWAICSLQPSKLHSFMFIFSYL